MKYSIIDTETTGLGEKDEVIQFSALLLDDSMKLEKVYNFFCYTQVPFNEEASKVTKLTPEIVHNLSGGKFFEDYYWELDLFKLKDVVWCGYNVGFDLKKINNTLVNNGLDPYDFGDRIVQLNKQEGIHYFDVMQLFRTLEGKAYSQSLDVCASKLTYSQVQLDAMYEKLLKITNMQTDVKFHNSLWDAMITWLYLAQNRGRC